MRIMNAFSKIILSKLALMLSLLFIRLMDYTNYFSFSDFYQTLSL